VLMPINHAMKSSDHGGCGDSGLSSRCHGKTHFVMTFRVHAAREVHPRRVKLQAMAMATAKNRGTGGRSSCGVGPSFTRQNVGARTCPRRAW
jgi:hypothetical protein